PRSDLWYSLRSSGLRIGARNAASSRALTSAIPATSASVRPARSAEYAWASSIPADEAPSLSSMNICGSTSRSSSSACDQSKGAVAARSSDGREDPGTGFGGNGISGPAASGTTESGRDWTGGELRSAEGDCDWELAPVSRPSAAPLPG